jgi:hypothetical protein
LTKFVLISEITRMTKSNLLKSKAEVRYCQTLSSISRNKLIDFWHWVMMNDLFNFYFWSHFTSKKSQNNEGKKRWKILPATDSDTNWLFVRVEFVVMTNERSALMRARAFRFRERFPSTGTRAAKPRWPNKTYVDAPLWIK